MLSLPPIFCLMGPTASGKTDAAIALVQAFPFEIISVDSAMVYRGMNIGTAKPTPEILRFAPHHLIDIADPLDPYSAGQFRIDVLAKIKEIIERKHFPLLVGGTFLYFRALHQGIASLPTANPAIREALQSRIENEGIIALHDYLKTIDPLAAARIHQHDSQRIQRALEVYLLTGQSITSQQQETSPLSDYHIHYAGFMPVDRALLHKRISKRFVTMLKLGLIEEVEHLFKRGDLSADLPAIRAVGYRQTWAYLDGQLNKLEMEEKAITATRQLAKRQITWLRSWPDVTLFNPDDPILLDDVSGWVKGIMDQYWK